jgi:hypothetical protein
MEGKNGQTTALECAALQIFVLVGPVIGDEFRSVLREQQTCSLCHSPLIYMCAANNRLLPPPLSLLIWRKIYG